jgi:type III secretion protein R
MQAAGKLWPSEEAKRVSAEDLTILLPSFMLSELTQAFQIGFILFVVFTVVDLLVAAILLALGMSMVSPLTLAIPFKLLLFVALDGWALLVQGMMLTYK